MKSNKRRTPIVKRLNMRSDLQRFHAPRVLPSKPGNAKNGFTVWDADAIDIALSVQLKRKQRFLYSDAEPWKVAFSIFDEDKETALIFKQNDLDPDNPFHWRAVLEALSQTLVREFRDRNRLSKLRFALDIDHIRVNLHKGKWRPSKVAQALKCPPYSTRYRVVAIEALRKRIRQISKEIGPMDDGDAVNRAYQIFDPTAEEAPPNLANYVDVDWDE